MHANAVPVRPRPPWQATSTRCVALRRNASANASAASARSLGSRKSGQRTHRTGHGSTSGWCADSSSAHSGTGPGGVGPPARRPRTRRPDGNLSTPGAFADQVTASTVRETRPADPDGTSAARAKVDRCCSPMSPPRLPTSVRLRRGWPRRPASPRRWPPPTRTRCRWWFRGWRGSCRSVRSASAGRRCARCPSPPRTRRSRCPQSTPRSPRSRPPLAKGRRRGAPRCWPSCSAPPPPRSRPLCVACSVVNCGRALCSA